MMPLKPATAFGVISRETNNVFCAGINALCALKTRWFALNVGGIIGWVYQIVTVQRVHIIISTRMIVKNVWRIVTSVLTLLHAVYVVTREFSNREHVYVLPVRLKWRGLVRFCAMTIVQFARQLMIVLVTRGIW